MHKPLSDYQHKFETLRVDRSHGEPAPHKPILLLAVIELIEEGVIKENKIYPSPLLVETFLKYWNLVKVDKPHIEYPFTYLRSEKFWHLHAKPGQHEYLIKNTFNSFAKLAGVIDYASLDKDLFDHLQSSSSRDDLRDTLIRSYFSQHHETFYSAIEDGREVALVEKLLIRNAENKDFKLSKEVADEKKRERGFSRAVKRLYDFTCAACYYRIITANGEAAVDAAHIYPFKESYDDSIGNGIALCKLHHWAFDRGLFSIKDNYKIIVASSFIESGNDNFSLNRLKSKMIFLPKEKPFRPSVVMLRWHRENKLIS